MPLGCCQSLYAVGVRVQPQASTSGRALPVQAFAHSLARNHGRHYRGATYERVLRYPDGAERRIRYPVPTEVGNIGNSGPSPEIHEDWETLNAWKATAPAAAGKRERAGAAPARQAAQAPTERTSRPAERREVRRRPSVPLPRRPAPLSATATAHKHPLPLCPAGSRPRRPRPHPCLAPAAAALPGV